MRIIAMVTAVALVAVVTITCIASLVIRFVACSTTAIISAKVWLNDLPR